MDKKTIRKIYKDKRAEIKNRDTLSELILNRLKSNFSLDEKIVSVFIPIESKNEVNTWALFEPVNRNEVFYCVPKINLESKEMNHFLYEGKEQLFLNDWGILEPKNGSSYMPSEFDFVIVPLLAFDIQGNRIGYGGGFYDRFLSKCKDKVVKVGLSFFEAEESVFETEETDIRLDFCVTPKKVYEFK